MEFDWRAESLAALGPFIRSPKNFLMPMHFFFDFLAAGEILSAMDMSARGRKDTRQSQGICHFMQLPRGRGVAFEARGFRQKIPGP